MGTCVAPVVTNSTLEPRSGKRALETEDFVKSCFTLMFVSSLCALITTITCYLVAVNTWLVLRSGVAHALKCAKTVHFSYNNL